MTRDILTHARRPRRKSQEKGRARQGEAGGQTMTLIEKIAHAIFVTTHAPTSWDSELFSIEQATAMYQARAAIKAMLANEDMIERRSKCTGFYIAQ